MYISPAPTSVRDVIPIMIPELVGSTCFQFKIAATPINLARSDKAVAYFADRDGMLEVAARLRKLLDGVPAHGVPFTCLVDAAGLLSWGVDPPPDSGKRVSWRSWICSELSQAMTEGHSGDRITAARARVAGAGIDPNSWEPRPDLWKERVTG